MNTKNSIINLAILLLFLLVTDISLIFDIPFYGLALGFILLTILPGLLIANLFKFGEMDLIKKIVYSVGISIFLLMIIGFLINSFGPLVGFSRPISFYSIIFSINCLIISLAGLSYYKHHLDFSLTDPLKKCKNEIFTIPSFCLFLILILGILSGLLIRYYQSSFVSVIFIIGIGILVILIAYEKIIPPAFYPYTLFIISLSLLLSRTLSSPYLFGSDIHFELFFQQLTQLNSYWDPSVVPNNLNTMLSTVMLPTIYSIVLHMDTISVYKIIFPIIFSLVPVIIYFLFNREIGNKFAFFSVFFFMSFYAYFLTLLWLPRQQVAELFLALFLVTLFEKELDNFKKNFLLILWTISLIVSHYATTYIFLVILLGVYLLIKIFSVRNSSLKLSIIFFYGVMTLSWYIFIADSTAFRSILDIGDKIANAIMNDAFSKNSIDPNIDQALGSGMLNLPFWHSLGHLWQIGTQFFIILGFIYLILKYKSTKINVELIFFWIIGILFLIISIVVPFFASSLVIDRIYHIVLIFISPLCIFGVLALTRLSAKLFRLNMLKSPQVVSTLMVVLLVPYFFFNAGAIFEITEKSDNFKLDLTRTADNIQFSSQSTFFISGQIIPIEDVIASKWISIHSESESKLYADTDKSFELVGYGLIAPKRIDESGHFPENGGYIFITFYNFIDNKYSQNSLTRVRSNTYVPIETILMKLKDRNFIYNNGAGIYK
jgi:uncharacterized membrane protein